MKAKRLVVLVAMLAMVLAAVPALAQEAVPEDRTLYFELTVEGEPPAGATFFALAPVDHPMELTDPDGDGVYTGSLAFPADMYPPCVPVEVFGENSPDELSYEIRYEPRFCFEDGDTFSAGYSFAGGEGTNGTGGTTGPANAVQYQGGGGTAQAAGVLPSTGGLVFPVAGLAGALLLGGGLLLRKK